MRLKIGLELTIMGLLNNAAKNASEVGFNTNSICDVIVGVNVDLELLSNKIIISRSRQAHEKLNVLSH